MTRKAAAPPWRSDRKAAAEYLSTYARSFTGQQILEGGDDVVRAAFAEATSMHDLIKSCEHCFRCTSVRDLLLGITPTPEGQLPL